MKQKDERDIELIQQGDNSTSLVGDQPQVFQVDGDLYYQAAPQEPQQTLFPLSPIPEPGIFVDREDLLKRIDKFFRESTEKVFLLEGMGGIGKTAFAAYVCRVFREFFQDVYWGICTEESSVERIVTELRSVFARNKDTISEQSWDTWRYSLQTQIQALLQKFEAKRYLLVFDDFQILLDHDGRIKDPNLEVLFHELIRGGRQSKLLILSRRSIIFSHQPAGVSVRKRMEALTIASAKNLLTRLGMTLPNKQFKALYQKVDGHPLALRVMADLYDRGLTVDRLLTIPFRNLSRESKEVFDDLFSELWKMMSVEEKKVLQGLSTYRIPVPLEALQTFYLDPEDSEEDFSNNRIQDVVRLLGEQCLVRVEKDENNRYMYTVPGIIREFIFRALTKKQQQEHHLKAATYWLSVEWTKKAKGHEGVQEKEEARYHCFQAEEYEQATQLAISLAEQLHSYGLYNTAKELLLKTREIIFSEEDLATIYNKLGRVSAAQRDHAQASKYYQQAQKILLDDHSLASLKRLIRRQGVEWLQASVEILAPPDLETFIKRLYLEIDAILRRFEETANLRQGDVEDRLNTDLVLLLRQRGYNANREEDHRGHTDILVRQDQHKWIGEGKIHRSYNDLVKGLRQLLTRYTTGREQYVGLIIYILNQNAKQVMRTWRDRLEKRLECGFHKAYEDPDNSLVFWSLHEHKGSGLELLTRHIGVSLFYAPED